jgi:hypothetical protein
MRLGVIWVAGLLILAARTGRLCAQNELPADYAVTPEVGPWMICVGSFTGEEASQMARKMADEVRSRYRLPAYIFNRGAELRQQQLEEQKKLREQQEEQLRRIGAPPLDHKFRIRHVRIEEQVAVLVGGYPDTNKAHAELVRIKKLEAPTSIPPDLMTIGKPGTGKDQGSLIPINPFWQSFVVPNPTVKRTKEKAPPPDPFWEKLNSGESYSLLQCPQPWTLAIKEYQVPTIVQPKSNQSAFERLFGKGQTDALTATAMNAHALAEALRKLGLEAYVLHTRTSSVVTIGGYASSNDPRMQETQQTLERLKIGPNLDLMPKPLPMQVPRLHGS